MRSGEVKGNKCDGRDTGDHKCEQDDNEPRGAIGGLRRGLSNPHCFDEDVRYEMDEVHAFLMVVESNSSRDAGWSAFVLTFASWGVRGTSIDYGLAASGVGAYT
jgi:hypothetical protein